jgi:dienelactone hydrolase
LRAAANTAVFFLRVLPMIPARPVDWITPEPIVERVKYPTHHGDAEGDLYLPSTRGPHPAMVVCLGVVPFGVDHPQVPRLGAALARAGFAALLYWSPAMRDLRMEPEGIEDLALAYRWLIERPMIDESRSGLLGTCVGGSFALMAAANPAIRDRVAFVIAWAPYASMRTLAADIASATTLVDGRRVPWKVDQLTRKVFVRSLTSVLEPAEAELLRTACAERDGQLSSEQLSEDGRATYPLLTALSFEEANAAVSRLPVSVLERLDAMSPEAHLTDLRAPLIMLAHDRDDQVIPIAESHRLHAELAGRADVRYAEFRMFKHLDPTKVRLPVFALVRELAKLLAAFYPTFRVAANRGKLNVR